jgi:hypothetical protein
MGVVQRKVMQAMNSKLLGEFTVDDIGTALNQMLPSRPRDLMDSLQASTNKTGPPYIRRFAMLFCIFSILVSWILRLI